MSPTIRLRHFAAGVLSLFICMAPQIASAASNTFSQARYISPSQFLSEVKEVSLTFEPDPLATKYISADEQRNYVANALVRYGIAVRPNSAVSLMVTFEHRQSTVRVTTWYTSGSTDEDYLIHDLFVSMQFFVRAAALRKGHFHLLVVAPTFCIDNIDWSEDTDFFSKSMFGNAYVKKFKDAFAGGLADCLKVIASETSGETAPWYVNSWTEKEKASADAEFTRIMQSQPAVEKRPFDGLDVAPELHLVPDNHGDKCVMPPWDPSWRKSWGRSFQRLSWVDTQGQAALTLKHMFWCYLKGSPGYYWLVDTISLAERNVVFELNGQLVRTAGLLFFSHRSTVSVEKDIGTNIQEYLPRSISEFVTDLVLGNPNTPVVAVPSDPRPTIPSAANRESPVQPAPGGASSNPGPALDKSSEPVRPAPAPQPPVGFGDLIGPGVIIRPPPGSDK